MVFAFLNELCFVQRCEIQDSFRDEHNSQPANEPRRLLLRKREKEKCRTVAISGHESCGREGGRSPPVVRQKKRILLRAEGAGGGEKDPRGRKNLVVCSLSLSFHLFFSSFSLDAVACFNVPRVHSRPPAHARRPPL